jgi:hypothetical protein
MHQWIAWFEFRNVWWGSYYFFIRLCGRWTVNRYLLERVDNRYVLKWQYSSIVIKIIVYFFIFMPCNVVVKLGVTGNRLKNIRDTFWISLWGIMIMVMCVLDTILFFYTFIYSGKIDKKLMKNLFRKYWIYYSLKSIRNLLSLPFYWIHFDD